MKEKLEFIAGFIIGVILVHLLFKKKDGLWDRIFNRWTKWELDKIDVPYTRTTYNPIAYGGNVIDERKVYFDIYVKTNKYTGIKKYKRVEKFQ